MELEKLIAICEAATPAPWKYYEGSGNLRVSDPIQCVGNAIRESDGEFIAAAREHFPEALRRLKRLQQIVQTYGADELGELHMRDGDVEEVFQLLDLPAPAKEHEA